MQGVKKLSEIVNEVLREEWGVTVSSPPTRVDSFSLDEFLAFLSDALKKKVEEVIEEAAKEVATTAINIAAYKFAFLLRLLLTDTEVRNVFNELPPHTQKVVLRTVIMELWKESLKDYARLVSEKLGGKDRNNLVVNLLVEKIMEKVTNGGRVK